MSDKQPPTSPSHWLDNPANVKRLYRGFLVVLAVTVIAQLGVHMHPHFEIDGLFAFNAWYGFLTCLIMIVVAKGLALLLKRPDTYYDDKNDE